MIPVHKRSRKQFASPFFKLVVPQYTLSLKRGSTQTSSLTWILGERDQAQQEKEAEDHSGGAKGGRRRG
jgi:hypothetical protein